jgi:hypothetical protein
MNSRRRLRGRKKPATTGIITAHRSDQPKTDQPKKNAVDDDALWLWGRLLDFERDGLLDRNPNDVCEAMLYHMKETVRELGPRVSQWLKDIVL